MNWHCLLNKNLKLSFIIKSNLPSVFQLIFTFAINRRQTILICIYYSSAQQLSIVKNPEKMYSKTVQCIWTSLPNNKYTSYSAWYKAVCLPHSLCTTPAAGFWQTRRQMWDHETAVRSRWASRPSTPLLNDNRVSWELPRVSTDHLHARNPAAAATQTDIGFCTTDVHQLRRAIYTTRSNPAPQHAGWQVNKSYREKFACVCITASTK